MEQQTIYDIIENGAKKFLDSIGRNSKSSQRTYAAGLLTFHNFLEADGRFTLSTVIKPLAKNNIDVYDLLNDFGTYLTTLKNPQTGRPLALKSIDGYMTAVRSYLQFNDLEITAYKFKHRVKMPKEYREDEEALDAADIRKIMLACNNRRLKPYLLLLASGGFRAVEACAIRICDINFEVKPTKIHVRKEYAKTRVARDVYVSDEATTYLKQWIDWKYRERKYPTKWGQAIEKLSPKSEDLVFTHYRNMTDARAIYTKIRTEFVNVLKAVAFEKRKEGMLRRTITLHSFRRYVKTVIADQVSKDYSEWFLGHSKSPYYTMKESMRREIYQTKCMKYLTFLDYSTLEATGKSIESELDTKDKEIQALKDEMAELRETLMTQQNVKKEMVKVEESKNVNVALIKELIKTVGQIPGVDTSKLESMLS